MVNLRQTLKIKWLCIAFEQMIKVHPYSFCTPNIIKEKVKVSLVLDCRVLLLAACIRVVEMSMPFKLECLYILVSHFKINVSFSIMQNLNFQWGNLREVSGNFRIFKFRLTDIIYLFVLDLCNIWYVFWDFFYRNELVLYENAKNCFTRKMNEI